jgi:hypothetical protein
MGRKCSNCEKCERKPYTTIIECRIFGEFRNPDRCLQFVRRPSGYFPQHFGEVYVVIGGQSCGDMHGRCHVLSLHWTEEEANKAAIGASWFSDGKVEHRLVVQIDDGPWRLVDTEEDASVYKQPVEEG